MSQHGEEWAVKCKGFRSPLEKAVLKHLAFRADKVANKCFPAQEEIAEAVMADTRTVRTHLQNLEQRGFITRLQKGNRGYPSVYLVHVGREIIPETNDLIPEMVSASPNEIPETVAPNTGNGCRIPETNDTNTGNGRMYQPKEPNIEPNKNREGGPPEKRVTKITPKFRQKMQEKYGGRLPDVQGEIDRAIAHKSFRKWDGKQQYVDGWLNRQIGFQERSPPGSRSGTRDKILAFKAEVDSAKS